jgi:hypothetical protein
MHMIDDHHGPSAGRANVLVRAVDGILGTHTTTIQIPVPQPERDHVRSPDHPARCQQPGGVAGEELVVGEDVDDEMHGGEQVRHRDERDHSAGDDPQPGLLAVDTARVPDDQCGQQREQDGRHNPGRVHPVFGGQRHMQNRGDHDRQRHRPPILPPPSGPERRHRWRSGWRPARCHISL